MDILFCFHCFTMRHFAERFSVRFRQVQGKRENGKNETALSFSERSSSIYPWSLKPEKSRRFLLFIILCFPIFISPFFSSVSIMFFVLFICFYVQTFALTAGRGTHLEDLFKWNSVNDITYTSCRVQFSMIICFYNFQNHNHWFAE